ncbi:MAG TPA: hypothetical protein VMZ92_04685 [Planctomycetota bacterium]|nr:hypothetical protein [Planctomycetota bacterium]
MRTTVLPLLVVTLAVGTACAGEADVAEKPIGLEEILNTAQLAHIARRRNEITVPPGSAYRFTFDKGPYYERVEVYYLIEERRLRGETVRSLAQRPSALLYVVTVPWNWELRKHLSEKQVADVLRDMLATVKLEGHDRMVRIRRVLFDIGGGAADEFVKDRDQYWNNEHGRPLFDKWPHAWRTPSGQFTVSIAQTAVVHAPAGSYGVPAVEAGQFFGYTFPVLDELLTSGQKEKLAADVRRINVQEGSAAVPVEKVGDFGDVKLHFLMKAGKSPGRPTAMESTVSLTAKEMADDPLILRKYLAPEGVAHLKKRIRAGGRLGKKLKSVELVRMHFDVVTKGEPGADATHADFKRQVQNYCRRNTLLKPETWEDRFRRPDGTFDVELTSVRVFWLVRKPE